MYTDCYILIGPCVLLVTLWEQINLVSDQNAFFIILIILSGDANFHALNC